MFNLLLQALVPLPMTSVQEAAWPEAAGSEAAPPQGGASDTLRTTVQGSGPVLSCDLTVCQVCCSLAAAMIILARHGHLMSHASPSAEQSNLRNLRQHSLARSSWHQRLPASCTRTVFQQVAREPLGGIQDGTVALDVQPHLREQASRLPDASSSTTEQAAALPPGSPSASDASSESDPFAWMASGTGHRAGNRVSGSSQPAAAAANSTFRLHLPIVNKPASTSTTMGGRVLHCQICRWTGNEGAALQHFRMGICLVSRMRSRGLLACPWLLLGRC